MPEEDKFWHHTDKLSDDECWEWKAYISPDGYGKFKSTHGQLAHRYSFFHHNPSDDHDMSKLVMHSCDNRKCVNPNHLSLGTHKDNSGDMVKKGRQGTWEHKGSKHPRAKINEALAKNIYLAKGKYKEIAEYFNVNYSTVLDVKSGRRWRHAIEGMRRNTREFV